MFLYFLLKQGGKAKQPGFREMVKSPELFNELIAERQEAEARLDAETLSDDQVRQAVEDLADPAKFQLARERIKRNLKRAVPHLIGACSDPRYLKSGKFGLATNNS